MQHINCVQQSLLTPLKRGHNVLLSRLTTEKMLGEFLCNLLVALFLIHSHIRENLRNAKRGLSETDQNICIEKPLSMQAEKETTRELTHQEKLQERLVRLKEWREQKKMSEQKAKAKKKAPFLVPGVCKSNSRTPVEDQNVSCIETKSCPKSIVQSKKILSDKSWNVTLHESSVKKKSLNKPFKPESISFAPKSFNFCAQLGKFKQFNFPSKLY